MGEKRMYCLVPYNLSEIQKGIQAAHAIAEHVWKHSSTGTSMISEEQQYLKTMDWINNWKTIIILNGGTTKNCGEPFGTMQKYTFDLIKLDINFVEFCEPDLNDALTAVAFILDMEEDSHVIGYLKQMNLA